jgi:hypothetical protein
MPINNTFIDFYGIMEYFINLDLELTPAALLAALKPKPKHKLVEELEAEDRLSSKSPKVMEKRSVYKEKKDSHNKAIYKITKQGQKWAEMVLQYEDMQIYIYKLLLKYTRIYNNYRE